MHGMNELHVHIYTGLWFWQCFSMASIRRAVLYWHFMGSSIPCLALYLLRALSREMGHSDRLQMARSSVAWRSLHRSNVSFWCWVMAVGVGLFHPAAQKI